MKRIIKLNQVGDHVVFIAVFIVLFGVVGTFFLLKNLASPTYVELHIGSQNGYCVDGASIDSCSSSNRSGVWQTMSGTFAIKSQNGQCLDDWGGGVGTNPKNRVYVHYTSCYGDRNQQWHWAGSGGYHELMSASGGCINGLGGGAGRGTQLIVYSCNNAGNEHFYESSISSGAGNNGGGSSGGGVTSYNNPLRSARYTIGRIDQGVDFTGSGPIYAIGPGRIEGATTGADWPGGTFIRYQLTSGIASGLYIYVAEDCTPTVSLTSGTSVNANTKLCDMYGGSSGIETGFAQPPSQGYIAMAYNEYGGRPDGTATNFGVLMSAFLKYIGGPGGDLYQSTSHGSPILDATPIPSAMLPNLH